MLLIISVNYIISVQATFIDTLLEIDETATLSENTVFLLYKIKVGVLNAFQQPGSYWDRSRALSLVVLKPTEVTAYE